VKIYVISDDQHNQRALLTVSLVDFTGNQYYSRELNVDIPGNSSRVCFDTLQSALLGNRNPDELLLSVTLKGTGIKGMQVKNILYFVSPKDLKLPVPAIEKKVTATATGYRIHFSTDKLVKNLFLSTSVKGDFSDNYFDLLTGESVDVQFTTPVKNMKMDDLIVIKSLIDTY
jgi:beta-mannosidase